MATTESYLSPGTELAGYRIESLVARGGMGVVYLATDIHLSRPVALKVLAPELSANEKFRSRFVRESQLAASVDHPNVIPVYGAGEWEGQLYIAMRYVRGTDLRSEILDRGPFDLAEALRILRDTAAALDAAHAAGLVHRDVKPGNIMLSDDRHDGHRHVYLMDFGLTKRSSSVTGMTTVGHFLGTLDYVAPEQIRGGDVDGRADVYALACVAYALLAGRPPFDHEDDRAQLWAHMYETPPPITTVRPDVPAGVEAAIQRGLAKERDERPPSCGALVAMMAAEPPSRPVALADEETAPTLPGEPSPLGPHDVGPGDRDSAPAAPYGSRRHRAEQRRRPERARRRPLLILLVGAAVLAAAAASLLLAPTFTRPETVTFEEDGLPYTLEVPESWTPRTRGSGATTVSVLSPADLTSLFLDEPAAVESAARTAEDAPTDVVGLAIYHQPFLPAGTDPGARVRSAEGLLPGTDAHLTDLGTSKAGDVDAQEMHGTLPLGAAETLQVHVVVVETEPVQMLVFFAPTRLYEDRTDTFSKVSDSLRLKE